MIRDAKLLQSYLRELLDSVPDASFLVNPTGRLVLANAQMKLLFGYEREALEGQSIDSLIPERFRRVHAGHCADYTARPRARAMGVGLSLYALRRDGTEFSVEISLGPIATDEGTYVLGAIRDISESEERYRAVFEQVAIGVVHSSLEGRVLNVNPKFCQMTGYTRDELLTLDIRRLTHPDDIGESVKARRRIAEGTDSDYGREVRLIRKDGTELWTHITTSPIRGVDGRPIHFISVIHDISSEKRSQAQQQETERRFRQLAENIHEVFWLTEPDKNQMLYVSPAYEAIWGRSAESLYASPRTWLDAIHPDDRQRIREAAESKQTSGKYDEEYRIVRPDGAVRWIRDRAFAVHDSNGAVIRIAGVAEDITETKRSADALRESERRFADMLQNVELISLMLDRNGSITYCNDYLLELTGWKRDEVVGGNWWKLFLPPEEHVELDSVFKSLLKERPHALHYVNEILTRTGERRLVHWNNTTLRSASGEIVGTASIGEDITDRRRAESALKESEERFRAVIEQSIAAVYVVQDGRVVYVNPRMREILGYGTDEQMVRRFDDEPTKAYSITALRKDGTPFVLGLHSKRALYNGRPAIIAVAQDITEKARAEEEARRYVERLKQAMQSTIEVVSIMGELRDPYTHGHERRVGEIAAAIAAEMGLEANRVEGIRVAGYLHDVGKISIPAEILVKPARLTAVEYELVKGHPRTSYEILKGVDFPWPVAQAALQHHERLDGSGYPQGLKGDAIILEARILAVADVIEAMASHRPYRAGLGIDIALAEIERGRGTVYDLGAADACLRLCREKNYKLPE